MKTHLNKRRFKENKSKHNIELKIRANHPELNNQISSEKFEWFPDAIEHRMLDKKITKS
jgi:hypothetical protein